MAEVLKLHLGRQPEVVAGYPLEELLDFDVHVANGAPQARELRFVASGEGEGVL